MNQRRRTFALGLATVLVVPLSACAGKSPGDILKYGVSALEAKDYDTVVGLYDIPTLRKSYGMGANELKGVMPRVHRYYADRGGVKKVIIKSENVDGNKAKVQYTIQYNEGSEESWSVPFVLDKDGRWKMAGFAYPG